MYYAISDSEGNTLDSFRDERIAEQSLLVMVAERPEDEDELLLLAYDDAGNPVGAARLAVDIRQERGAAALERRTASWYAIVRQEDPETVGTAGAVTTIRYVFGADVSQVSGENDTDGHVEIPA